MSSFVIASHGFYLVVLNFTSQSGQSAQSKASRQRAKAKVSTGKYDMFVLRELGRTEEAALQELIDMYQVS